MANEANETRDLSRIRRFVDDGRAWIKSNPDAWHAGEAHALACAGHNRPVTWHGVASTMTARDYTDRKSGEGVKLNNYYGPLFMRWLRALHPELGAFMRLRATMFDRVSIGGPYDR